jgi:hypothetical protein
MSTIKLALFGAMTATTMLAYEGTASAAVIQHATSLAAIKAAPIVLSIPEPGPGNCNGSTEACEDMHQFNIAGAVFVPGALQHWVLSEPGQQAACQATGPGFDTGGNGPCSDGLVANNLGGVATLIAISDVPDPADSTAITNAGAFQAPGGGLIPSLVQDETSAGNVRVFKLSNDPGSLVVTFASDVSEGSTTSDTVTITYSATAPAITPTAVVGLGAVLGASGLLLLLQRRRRLA